MIINILLVAASTISPSSRRLRLLTSLLVAVSTNSPSSQRLRSLSLSDPIYKIGFVYH